jgi:hypothetical protein
MSISRFVALNLATGRVFEWAMNAHTKPRASTLKSADIYEDKKLPDTVHAPYHIIHYFKS